MRKIEPPTTGDFLSATSELSIFIADDHAIVREGLRAVHCFKMPSLAKS